MARPIDADKLINRFNALSVYDGITLIRAIQEQPTIEAEPVKQGRWIPCSERLPEYEERVLLQLKDNSIRDGRLRLVDAKYPMWCIEEFFTYLLRYEVIAWMPLPEPYKMDE